MSLLIDTHALFWLITGDKRLSKKARLAIDSAEKVFIPTIVLLELLSLLEKKGLQALFDVVLKEIQLDKRYIPVSLDLALIYKVTQVTAKIEMHDKVILASALLLNVPIVTRDRLIRKNYSNTIW